MIARIISYMAVAAGLAVVLGEIMGYRFITRFFCNHPPDQIGWNGGARICKRCGKEVTLWE